MDEIDAKVRRVKQTIMSLHDKGLSNGQILDHLASVDRVDYFTISDVAHAIREGKKSRG